MTRKKLEKLLATLEVAIQDYEENNSRNGSAADEISIKRAFTQLRRELELESAKWTVVVASSSSSSSLDAETESLRRISNSVNELDSRFRAAVSSELKKSFRTTAEKRAELFSTTTSHDRNNNTNGTLLEVGVNGGGSLARKSRSEILSDADLLAQARDANASLLRTRDVMARELERVSKVSEVLSHDTEMLRGVGKDYEAVSETMDASSSVLNRMQLRERLDKYMVYIGLGFFLLVVLYILKRRLLPMVSPLVWIAETVFGAMGGAEVVVSQPQVQVQANGLQAHQHQHQPRQLQHGNLPRGEGERMGKDGAEL